MHPPFYWVYAPLGLCTRYLYWVYAPVILWGLCTLGTMHPWDYAPLGLCTLRLCTTMFFLWVYAPLIAVWVCAPSFLGLPTFGFKFTCLLFYLGFPLTTWFGLRTYYVVCFYVPTILFGTTHQLFTIWLHNLKSLTWSTHFSFSSYVYEPQILLGSLTC
jgi:hypothetical protein